MSSMINDLPKRAVSCNHWRWVPGMLVRGFDPTTKHPAWMRLREFHSSMSLTVQAEQLLQPWPDFSDPATLGCLLAIVRDAHRDAYMSTGNDGPTWVVRDCDGYVVCTGTSERAVLVEALEAAS